MCEFSIVINIYAYHGPYSENSLTRMSYNLAITLYFNFSFKKYVFDTECPTIQKKGLYFKLYFSQHNIKSRHSMAYYNTVGHGHSILNIFFRYTIGLFNVLSSNKSSQILCSKFPLNVVHPLHFVLIEFENKNSIKGLL